MSQNLLEYVTILLNELLDQLSPSYKKSLKEAIEIYTDIRVKVEKSEVLKTN